MEVSDVVMSMFHVCLLVYQFATKVSSSGSPARNVVQAHTSHGEIRAGNYMSVIATVDC